MNQTVKILTTCRDDIGGKTIDIAPVNILPTRGRGGGHTRGFRQKTIPDRREFDKLMESGSQVIDFGRFLHPGTGYTTQAQGWGFRQK